MANYDAFMQEGKQLRSQKRFADAEARFDAAAAVAPAGSPPFALARYFAGLTHQDRLNDAAAVAPLSEAIRIYETTPGETQAAALAGAALGLCLLRSFQWSDAAHVIEESNRRLGDSPQNANALAAGLHNLAMAHTRGGDARRGLEAAQKALALRQKINGPSHPSTIETLLIEAYARIEMGDLDGAGAQIRRAGRAVLSGGGEAHSFFADVLLTEARRVARKGDGCAAEALARRAMFILKQAGIPNAVLEQRERDAHALGMLWKTGSPAKDVGDVALWRISMQHTLRRYQAATLDFASSSDRPMEWFFFVPADWPLSQALYAARLAFAGTNMTLNKRQPSDPNFLDVTQATASVPDLKELRDTKFADRFRERVWEASIAYTTVSGTMSLPLKPADFARALAAQGVPSEPLLPLVEDAGLLAEARSKPTAALKSALMFLD
jgi:tetratricopeptide (TPR) repeat protein